MTFATIETEQEMDEFSERHGLPLVPRNVAESEVQAVYNLLRQHLQAVRRDTSLSKEDQCRLVAGFEARRRIISAAVARESRRTSYSGVALPELGSAAKKPFAPMVSEGDTVTLSLS